MKNILKLYLVTDRDLSLGRSLEEVVSEAVAGGVTVVQLREKDASTGEFVELAFRLKEILKQYNVPLIINDRVDVALAVDAEGLHIGQSDMPYEIARKLLGPDKIIGLSVENMDDLLEANKLDVDYVGISPVYGTPTKTDTAEPFGLEGLRRAVGLSVHPTVAIGGMNADTIADVMAAGTDGVAVVSAICSAESPKLAAKELKDIIEMPGQAGHDDCLVAGHDVCLVAGHDVCFVAGHECNAGFQPIEDTESHARPDRASINRGEFGFIDMIRQRFDVPVGMMGIGDDCAVIPAGKSEFIYSTDMLMEGVHFLRDVASPEDIGWKSLAVNLSDIAAMGGTPSATFLSIALPKDVQGEWAERFIEGYAELSKRLNVPLLGGDTTSSLRDIAINVGVLGRVPPGKSVKRSGASVGHGIYVTGNLGDSAGGLQAILNNWDKTQEVESLIQSHIKPMPRIEEGQALMNTELIGAMMDISDGIASDLRNIMKASGVGAEVHLDRIPMSYNLKWACEKYGKNAYVLAAGGGEDYELLFTAPADIEYLVDFPIYRIGDIVPDNSLTWLENGCPVDFDIKGFSHF